GGGDGLARQVVGVGDAHRFGGHVHLHGGRAGEGTQGLLDGRSAAAAADAGGHERRSHDSPRQRASVFRNFSSPTTFHVWMHHPPLPHRWQRGPPNLGASRPLFSTGAAMTPTQSTTTRISLRCPSCNARLRAARKLLGLTCPCPRCRYRI